MSADLLFSLVRPWYEFGRSSNTGSNGNLERRDLWPHAALVDYQNLARATSHWRPDTYRLEARSACG
jgi:hypothetical protein